MNKTIFAVPTGYRPDKAYTTILKWKDLGFKIIAYFWDMDTFDKCSKLCDIFYTGKRCSFAILHNFMCLSIKGEWTNYICGADDLWPGKGMYDLLNLKDKYNGKILWIYDGLNKNINTHQIITKKWYDKYNFIFDEKFNHNCCDTDLMIRAGNKNEIVKIKSMSFDHRHVSVTNEDDIVYKIGRRYYDEDKNYLKSKWPKHRLRFPGKGIPTVEI